MKAVRIHAHGGGDQLRYEDGDEPALRREDDVIVKLNAAAVNRIDLALRAGSKRINSFPRILGADGAGIVHAVGARALGVKRGVDVAVNCIGGESWALSLAALAHGGRLVTCGAVSGAAPKTNLRRIFWNHLKVLAAHSATRREFGRVLSFFAASQHKPIIDAIFPLKDAARARERPERRKQFGKIVLRTDE